MENGEWRMPFMRHTGTINSPLSIFHCNPLFCPMQKLSMEQLGRPVFNTVQNADVSIIFVPPTSGGTIIGRTTKEAIELLMDDPDNARHAGHFITTWNIRLYGYSDERDSTIWILGGAEAGQVYHIYWEEVSFLKKTFAMFAMDNRI